MKRRRAGFVIFLIGLIILVLFMRGDHYALLRGLDVAELVASGFFFGFGFALLLASLRPSPE